MSVPAYRAVITTAATIILTVAAAIHIDVGITTLFPFLQGGVGLLVFPNVVDGELLLSEVARIIASRSYIVIVI